MHCVEYKKKHQMEKIFTSLLFAVPDKASLAPPSAETSPFEVVFPCFEILTEDLPFSLRARTMKQEEKLFVLLFSGKADWLTKISISARMIRSQNSSIPLSHLWPAGLPPHSQKNAFAARLKANQAQGQLAIPRIRGFHIQNAVFGMPNYMQSTYI